MSATSFLVLGALAVLLLIFLFRPVNPKNKTDDQLLQSYRFAIKGGDLASDDRKIIEEEMKRRGLLSDELLPLKSPSQESHFVQLAANRIRTAAQAAYDETFQQAQAQRKSEQVCHEVALMNVLVSRLQNSTGAPPLTEEVLKLVAIEMVPFRDLSPADGKSAIVEYVVWREHPKLANEKLISNAVQKLESTLPADLFQSLDGAPFPWTKFL